MKAIDAQPNTHYTRPGGTVDGIRDRDTTTRAAQLGVSEGMMTHEDGQTGILWPCDYHLLDMDAERSRPIVPSHVDTLASALRDKNNLICDRPIYFPLPGGKWGVRDGQHRTLAAMRLNLAIPFVVSVSMTERDVREMNAAKRGYTPLNHMESMAKRDENYARVLAAIVERKATRQVTAWVCLCSGHIGYSAASLGYKDGTCTFPHTDWAMGVWDLGAELHAANERTPLRNGRFFIALAAMSLDPNMRADLLPAAFQRAGSKIGPRNTIADYRAMIADAYNWRRATSNRVDADADYQLQDA